MKLTVVPSDKVIIKDGVSLECQNWPFDDSNINAIQWDGSSGEIEYVDVQRKPGVPTQGLIDSYSTFFDEQKIAAEAWKDVKVINYQGVREPFYPPMADQLDAIYWASHGDPSKLDEINAKISQVKADYPKDMDLISYNELNALLEQ